MIRHLPRDRFTCTVVSLSSKRMRLADRFRDAGIDVVAVDQSGWWSWSCLWKLYRYLRAFRPQVAHTWLFTADLYGRLAARLAGVPVVVSSVRSVETWKKRHYIVVDWMLQHLTDIITVNAEAIRPMLEQRDRIHPEKIKTIYNGVDLDLFACQSINGTARTAFGLGADPVVGILGRLMPEKDHRTFLRAAALVARERPAARFLIVGDGPLRETLREEARRLAIEDRVTFAGFRHDRAVAIQAIDVVVLSSIYEGCANAILEAMAMAKPVVATDVGGNGELVVHGRTGLLVPGQDPDAMARAIVSLLRDPDRARAMGRSGRERVEHRFTIERMVEQTVSLYERFLTGHGVRDK